ncbi:hypothetical protein CspeluHIS016_0600150 [Cutaneotrichosporon spelunceum]|uniref:Uncharacterized protein n=1 Tax=Cutaneotrichosporon spelunceum TaxID=1672016 RepID=A0AAD3TX94_9TREE|nr:hypothetical protein CspeluHIS016_0600150 [Cutaneotrichosporon spelunceum]
MTAPARDPRPLPAHWKALLHPPTLPAAYPPLLPLVSLSPPMLELALRAPVLSAPVLRARNEHLILAQRGDAYIRVALLQIGADLGLTLSGRHHLVSDVGANATLAHIALESGVLDAAVAQRKMCPTSLCHKAAAGIFEALAAVMEDEMGPRAAEILKIALFPWAAAVVEAKVVPLVKIYEGAKAAVTLMDKVAHMMEEMMAASAGHTGVIGTDGVMGSDGIESLHDGADDC